MNILPSAANLINLPLWLGAARFHALGSNCQVRPSLLTTWLIPGARPLALAHC